MVKLGAVSTIVLVLALAAAALAQSEAGAVSKAAAPETGQSEAAKLQVEIHQKIEALLADSPHKLFTRHLRSVDALVQAEWVRVSLTEKPSDKLLTEFTSFAGKIRDGLKGEAGKWDSYASGNRGLIFAFVSSYDRTLQLYSLTLPKGWDPEKTYPIIVYLHGRVGTTSTLRFAGWSFGQPRKPKPKPEVQADAKTEPAAEMEPHFRIGPWGRGNTGYRDAGEVDVWEALKDARANFKTDKDRTYLCGHSMGGFGTWAIGQRTPDVWAALGIYSGADRYAPAGTGLAGNIAHMPVHIWHGDKDRAVPVERGNKMAAELLKYGNEAHVVIAENVGHMIPRAGKPALRAWLLQHRRKRPDSFSYIADTRLHTGAWGITMRRDEAKDPRPRFECKIEGNTVNVNSTGTTGLDVVLGTGGLGLDGDITVIWNGKEAYKGPVKQIQLGDGAGRRRSRNRRRRR
jgi:predicted esterase